MTQYNHMFSFASEYSNFFNYIFLTVFLLFSLGLNVYWYLSLKSYLKVHNNVIANTENPVLKPPSKIGFIFIELCLVLSSLLFITFIFANNADNAVNLKHLSFQDNNIVLSVYDREPSKHDVIIPLSSVYMISFNEFVDSKYENVYKGFCQISFKQNIVDSSKKSEKSSVDILLPTGNLSLDEHCLEITKLISHHINSARRSKNNVNSDLLIVKTETQIPVTYTSQRDKILKFTHYFKSITKPGSFFNIH